MNKKFTFIIYTSEDNNLDRTLDSISKQNYDLNRVEIIIVSENKIDSLDKIIKYYEEKIDIKYLSGKNNYVDLINDAKELANGELISFIDSNDYFDKNNVLNKIDKLSNSNKIISISSIYYDSDTEKYSRFKVQPINSGLVNLNNTPYELNLNLNSYFISKDLINSIKFDSSFYEEAKLLFIIELLKNNSSYYYCYKSQIITTKPYETNTSKCAIQYNKWWYEESIEKFIDYTSKLDSIPKYIQEILLYIIYNKINCNIYDRNKRIVAKDDAIKFLELVAQLAKYIDNDVLLKYDVEQKRHFRLQRWIAYYIAKLKYNGKKNIYIDNNRVVIDYGKEKIINEDTLYETVNVFAINYDDGKLVFDCTTSLKDVLDEDEFNIYIKYNNKKIEINRSYFYPLLKAFGKTITQSYCFNFSVDISECKNSKIEAFAVINNKEIPLNFKYNKVSARLNNSKKSFWHYKNFVLYNKQSYIQVKKAHLLNLMFSEILFDLSKLKNVKNKKRAFVLIMLRMLYYITKPFYKNKHIWLTWDKLYKAGDNGEYIYQYCLKQNRNIYYFVKSDSPDYDRLRKQNKKRCVRFNSLKAKLLSLHSEAILDTHANVISYCGFDGMARQFASGLFNPDVICIQHGLTVQKIAQYQNRLFDNIKYYCCASQFEVDNIMSPLYDYKKEQISLTGLARYDGLKSKSEKIILITPTWRRDVVNSSVAYIKKKHNNNFKNSEYYRIYNSLINNKELIDCAKENGYKIIYLLHPAMSGQLEDFTKNDFVEIVQATSDINYEDILTRSALMVTDYSGVQFDFAYQRKVLVYYHPDTLPPHYDAGGLDYETMGFGPICKNEEQIVKELCTNMKNGCIIQDEYKKRSDKFFAFDDFDNCKRILEAVDNYFSNKK